MKPVKLQALDEADLNVIAALVQDGLTKPQAMEYDPKAKTFLIVLNRFAWDSDKVASRKRSYERRQAVLSFSAVSGVQSLKINRRDQEQVLSILSVGFATGEEPAGTIEVLFADGPVLRLDVDGIEVQLADLGAAWETRFKPRHPLS